MKKNLFEMGANWEDDWTSDNKTEKKTTEAISILAPDKHRLHLSKEKRRGKVVTIVQPFHRENAELKSLLKALKKKLGTGGTIRDNTLEFQGDIPEKLRHTLAAMGYRFQN